MLLAKLQLLAKLGSFRAFSRDTEETVVSAVTSSDKVANMIQYLHARP